MHLVIGAAEYAGRYAIAELSTHFPVQGVELSEDLETAMAGVETVYMAAELHSPLLRLRAAPGPDPRLVKLVRRAEAAGVPRLAHLSTAQVLGPAPRSPLFEESPIKPYHAYEKLHARDEQWLLGQRGIETVTLRPRRGSGRGRAGRTASSQSCPPAGLSCWAAVGRSGPSLPARTWAAPSWRPVSGAGPAMPTCSAASRPAGGTSSRSSSTRFGFRSDSWTCRTTSPTCVRRFANGERR